MESTNTAMTRDSVIAVYKTHVEAEAAVTKLEQSGFEMKHLSIVGRDYHSDEHVVGYYNAGDRMKYWGKQGAIWGGFWGLLFGSAFFWIPGLGPVLVAGPLVAWIIAALEQSVIVGGFSALSAAFASIGIPDDSVLQYETEIKAGKFVLITYAPQDETLRAKAILEHSGPEQLRHFPHDKERDKAASLARAAKQSADDDRLVKAHP